MSTTSDKLEPKSPGGEENRSGLLLRILSFGYKMGKPPSANAIFDVRFLKNPYWVEELRPLSGKDAPVQEYVMAQKAARDFHESILELLVKLIPQLQENNLSEFSVAFGCTGGQHRSATMVELLSREISEHFPGLRVEKVHRELDGKHSHEGKVQEDKQ